MKNFLVFIYIKHFTLFVFRNNLVSSYLVKKLIHIFGFSLFTIFTYLISKNLEHGGELEQKSLKIGLYLLITFFLAILASITKTSPILKSMKEYLLMPYSVNNISLSILLLSIFELDYIFYYSYILVIGWFIEINIIELFFYIMIIQNLFFLTLLYVKRILLIFLINFLIGFFSYSVIKLCNFTLLSVLFFMLPFFLVSTFSLYKSITKKITNINL